MTDEQRMALELDAQWGEEGEEGLDQDSEEEDGGAASGSSRRRKLPGE